MSEVQMTRLDLIPDPRPFLPTCDWCGEIHSAGSIPCLELARVAACDPSPRFRAEAHAALRLRADAARLAAEKASLRAAAL